MTVFVYARIYSIIDSAFKVSYLYEFLYESYIVNL